MGSEYYRIIWISCKNLELTFDSTCFRHIASDSLYESYYRVRSFDHDILDGTWAGVLAYSYLSLAFSCFFFYCILYRQICASLGEHEINQCSSDCTVYKHYYIKIWIKRMDTTVWIYLLLSDWFRLFHYRYLAFHIGFLLSIEITFLVLAWFYIDIYCLLCFQIYSFLLLIEDYRI